MSSKHILVVSVLVFVAAIPIDAVALAQRTFVASSGSDANSCALAQPCRSFAAAITQTAPGGEVIVLDSAGYGPVTITQSVSIIAPSGVYAGISVFAPDDGVAVAAAPTDKVVLRGLSISGQGGMHGIFVGSGAEVHVENCTVSGMTGNGIFVVLSSGSVSVQIRNTSVRSNGGVGLWVAGGGPAIQIVDSDFSLNGYGNGVSPPLPGIVVNSGTLNAQRIVANANAQFGVTAAAEIGSTVGATISDSMISGNKGGAVVASQPGGGGSSSLTLVRSTVSRNTGDGLFADGSGTGAILLAASDSAVTENTGAGVSLNGATTNALVTRSTVARNVGADFSNTGGVFRSSGNNTLSGRGAPDIQGTITPNPPQ